MDREYIERCIAASTQLSRPFLVPELELSLITPASPWWTKTPEELDREGVPEPYWGFAWAGGQSLARFLLDHPEWVAGKNVIDFGTGGGIVALAALKAGARHVVATEIDPWAILASQRNLRGFCERIRLSEEDWIGRALDPETILLCGDMSYAFELCQRLQAWFRTLERCTILVGDPGRGFLDTSLFTELASYQAPADSDFDGSHTVPTSVLKWAPGPRGSA